jgi:hypothetical protein
MLRVARQPKLFSKINAFSKFIRAKCTYSRAVSISDSQRKNALGGPMAESAIDSVIVE